MKYRPEEQYLAMKYSYDELMSLANDVGDTAVLGYQRPKEAARNFFINCYHLKDWLKKDNRIKDPKNVEKYINQSKALKMAKIICNSIKHAGLDKESDKLNELAKINLAIRLDVPYKQNAQAYIKAERNPEDGDTIEIFSSSKSIIKNKAIATYSIIITIGDEKYNALELAVECKAEWDQFLSINNLDFSKV